MQMEIFFKILKWNLVEIRIKFYSVQDICGWHILLNTEKCDLNCKFVYTSLWSNDFNVNWYTYSSPMCIVKLLIRIIDFNGDLWLTKFIFLVNFISFQTIRYTFLKHKTTYSLSLILTHSHSFSLTHSLSLVLTHSH